MNKDKRETKIDKPEFNTYCIFTEEKQSVKETIGLIFKDYIKNTLFSGREASEK